ncbi:hypothetical protein Vafri_2803 [Volvox africanus]|uniref:R3H domain-containing protein n=1 Tax=Volvox africanus TaxID=51714 RepID=A0A8J4AQY8_9CHLO|nr:hypothetical protein Vafri_2803 [Volvox africanus]
MAPKHGSQAQPTAAAGDKLVSFPPCLSARQRAFLHEVAQSAGLHHASEGSGEGRFIVVGSLKTGAQKVTVAPPAAGLFSDSDLCEVLRKHLGLDTTGHLSCPPAPSGRSGGNVGAGVHNQDEPATVEAFVELTRRLIDMERAAEIEQANVETSLCSPEAAQATVLVELLLICRRTSSVLTMLWPYGQAAGLWTALLSFRVLSTASAKLLLSLLWMRLQRMVLTNHCGWTNSQMKSHISDCLGPSRFCYGCGAAQQQPPTAGCCLEVR